MITYKNITRTDRSLRPYQQQAKENIFMAWDECDNVMFQMPTGTGKTRLFTSIISDIKTWGVQNSVEIKILIVAHRIELIEQISENLGRYKVSHGIIAGGKPRDLRYPVQVASIQTITHRNNLDVARNLNVNFIIIDEAHHCVANSYKKLWDMYPEAKKLGVTATPWRMNHLGFITIFDKLIVSASIKQFIKEGWLAPYCYYSVKDTSSIRKDINGIDEFDSEGDYKVSALERVMDNSSIRANLLQSYLTLANGKKGIIYSVSRKHSDHICAEYRQAGINIVRIDSETPRNERRLYVQRFKKGLIDIIVNVDIFSEGFDCPDIEFIQLARPTKSLVKYLQQVGRGLRPTSKKSKCIILDNVGAHIEFNLPDADRFWEKEFVGELAAKRIKKTSVVRNAPGTIERSFEEGVDELCLIEDIKENPIVEAESERFKWLDKDDELLKTLYIERQCPIEVIAVVFKQDESAIKNRIQELNLIQS